MELFICFCRITFLTNAIWQEIKGYFLINVFLYNLKNLPLVLPLSSRQHKKAKLPTRVDIQSARVALVSFEYVCNCSDKYNPQSLVVSPLLIYTVQYTTSLF